MALTKANTKGKVPQRPQAPQAQTPQWPGIQIPPQSPIPGFNFDAKPFGLNPNPGSASPWSIPDQGGGHPGAPTSNPWAMLGQQPQAPAIDFNQLFTAMRHDPQGDANSGYIPGTDNAQSPFSNGFFNQGAASMSPESRQATQGNSAMTQWAQLGGVPGVDPAKLAAVQGQQTQLPSSNPTPASPVSDPYFHLNLLRALGYAPQSSAPR